MIIGLVRGAMYWRPLFKVRQTQIKITYSLCLISENNKNCSLTLTWSCMHQSECFYRF